MSLPSPSLVEWKQTIARVGDASSKVHDQVAYAANIDPAIVQRSRRLQTVSQSGEATAWFGAYKPPPPAIDAAYLVEDPHVEIDRIDDVEYRTTWQYVYAVPADTWADDGEYLAFARAEADWPDSGDIDFTVAA